jgi:hypothetical protein
MSQDAAGGGVDVHLRGSDKGAREVRGISLIGCRKDPADLPQKKRK